MRWICAWALALPMMAQTTSPRPAPARPAAIPHPRELKYPALGAVPVPAVETITLSNGLKVCLLEDHELPVVSGTALVRTGNLFDPREKIGLATLTGMAIRMGGTRTKTGPQLDEQLESMAASVESSIGETSGSVSFSALKENTGEVLAVFKDVLTAPALRQDRIDFAKAQLRNGIARRNDDARSIAQREFSNTVYGRDNPYGWSEEYATIDRIQRPDVEAFYRRYFFPANVLIGIRGDFEAAGMKAALEKLFSDWTVKQDPVPPFPKVSAVPAGGVYLAVKKDVSQTFFAVGELGGQFKDADYPALELMASVLGGGFQSRLVQRVRTRMGNAYEISASWNAGFDHPGLFEIAGSTKSISALETLKAVREEVDRIRTAEVTDEELRTAKESALSRLVFAYDSKTKVLARFLTFEYFGYPRDFIQQYQKGLMAVTRADVLRAARQHLDPAKLTILAVGSPDDFAQPLDSLGGPVIPLDLTLPPPKPDTHQPDTASLEQGRKVLERAQKAVGGADKLAAVKDCTATSDFQFTPEAGGALGHETDRWIAPTTFRQESVLPAGRIMAFYDGQYGWVANATGSGPLTGPFLKQVQGDLFRIYFRLLLSDRIPGRVVSALDENTVEISDSSGEVARLVLDPETGLPQKVLYETLPPSGPPVSVQEDWFDFREVNGVQLPHKTTVWRGGMKTADSTVTSYLLNSGLKAQDLMRRP